MDNLTPEERHLNMKNIKSINTQPEKMVFKELRKRKIYFTKHVKKIIGKPDIVFRNGKVIVFIDSDFWHMHPENFSMPKTNVDYWTQKISRNKERDREVTSSLEHDGWKVLRYWQSDIKKNLSAVVDDIVEKLGERRSIN